MAIVVNELVNRINFRVNFSQIRRVERSFDRIGRNAEQIGRNISAAITLPFAALSVLSIKAASDAIETENKFDQVFEGMTQEANAFVDSYSKGLRRSETFVRDNIATLQSFALGMGLGKKEAFGMAKTLQGLVLDFASFHNISDDNSFRRFISALSGSSQVLDRFGIDIKVASLNLELQRLGLAESTLKATELQRVMARLSLIQRAMGRQGALGDAKRTMFEFASALKSTRGVLKDLLADFGKELIPLAKGVLNAFNNIVLNLKNKLTPQIKRVIISVGILVAAVGPLLLIFTGIAGAVALFSSALGALSAMAFTAGTTVSLLLGKFVLIGVAIAAVGVALALVVEDLLLFQARGNSLIGLLIERFGDLVNTLKVEGVHIVGVFSDIFGGIRDFFDGLIEFVTGVFMGKWRFAIQSLGKVIISVFSNAIRLATLPFQAVLDVLNKLTGSNANAGNLGNQFAGVASQGLAALTAQGSLPSSDINAQQIAQESINNFNVNSNINMNFPVGTDQTTIDNADQQLRKAVRDEIMFEVRKAVVDNPRVQR